MKTPSLLFLLPLAASLAAPASAQEAKKDERGKPHVLHLVDGRSLRVTARCVSDDGAEHWEIRQGKGRDAAWVALPDDAVVRATSEAELLAQARKLEREVGKDDPTRRAAYAEWLTNEGLQVEALQQLDRVFEADPDQAEALALVARANFPVALPPIEASSDEATLASFVSTAASTGPAVREIAVHRLAEVTEAAGGELAGLDDLLVRELVDRNPRQRAFAALCLRRLMPGHHARPLLSRSILDSSEEVRESAALALRDFGNEAVVVPALRALGSEDANVRKNAAVALGTMGYPAAAKPLYSHLVALKSAKTSPGAPRANIFVGRQVAYIQDFDVEVAQFQSIADPIINVLTEGAVLDAAVTGTYEYVVQSERAAVRGSLARLTGASPGNTTAAWQSWWKNNGDAWVAANVPAAPDAPTTQSSRY